MHIRRKWNDNRRDVGRKRSNGCNVLNNHRGMLQEDMRGNAEPNKNSRGNVDNNKKTSRDSNSKGKKKCGILSGHMILSDLISPSMDQLSLTISWVSGVSRILLLKTTSSMVYLEAMIHSRTFSEVEDPLLR